MSDLGQGAVHTEKQDYPHTVPEAQEHEHPSDLTYIWVAVWLAALTALEVSTYLVDFGGLHVPVLIVLMGVKFGFVVAFFMHLRFDSKLFRRLFITGLATALVVYLAALTMFHYWD